MKENDRLLHQRIDYVLPLINDRTENPPFLSYICPFVTYWSFKTFEFDIHHVYFSSGESIYGFLRQPTSAAWYILDVLFIKREFLNLYKP